MNHSTANQSCDSFLVGRGAVLDKVRAIPRVAIAHNLTAKHGYVHAVVTQRAEALVLVGVRWNPSARGRLNDSCNACILGIRVQLDWMNDGL